MTKLERWQFARFFLGCVSRRRVSCRGRGFFGRVILK